MDVVENKGAASGRTNSFVLDSSLSAPTKNRDSPSHKETHRRPMSTPQSRHSPPMSIQDKRNTHQAQGPGSTSSHVALRRNCPSLNSLGVCRANNPSCWLPVSWTPIPVPPKKGPFPLSNHRSSSFSMVTPKGHDPATRCRTNTITPRSQVPDNAPSFTTPHPPPYSDSIIPMRNYL